MGIAPAPLLFPGNASPRNAHTDQQSDSVGIAKDAMPTLRNSPQFLGRDPRPLGQRLELGPGQLRITQAR